MERWIAFWGFVLAGGLAAFYAIVLVVIPLGVRDMLRIHHGRTGSRGNAPKNHEHE